MKNAIRPAGVAVLSLSLGACAAFMPQEDDPVYQKQVQLEQRVERLERALESDGLVEMLAEIQALQKETQLLRNDIESLQFATEQSAERQRKLYLDVDQRLQVIEKAGIVAAGVSVLDGGALAPGELPVPGGSDRDNYQAAFELLKQGRYEEAGAAFQQFMVAFPESNLQDNAQYWLAETYYVRQEFEDALPLFLVVPEKYPQSRKVPDALLKIGYCNYELKRWSEARTALEGVVERYPETTAARLSEQRLQRMTNEGR